MDFTAENLIENKKFVNEILINISKYSNDEIIITDKKFNIKFHNSKLITESKIKSLFDVTHFIINNDVKKQIFLFAKTEKNHVFFKLIIKGNKALDNIPVNFHLCKIKDKQGKIHGYCVIIQDILQEIRNKIQKATFVDIISHDLKNPMRANIQILELILKNKFGETENTLKPILKELLNSCRFMNYMADNLLLKYKNEFDIYELKKQKYSIIKLIKDTCNKLSDVLERKNQTAELIINGKINDVYIDIEEMSKVINNLIINASEQSIENSKIIIKVENKNNKIFVSFTDYGYKQKKEVLNDMFEEYISCSNKFRKVGFSLDLFNCRKIIEAHNGSINADTKSDKGTSITFSIPV